ncbi:MAG: glycosyltransferase family 9 protein [Xanthomonadales bacterium]|nr:glycosyltransferase family 9 protein [Xanthomonadales bacterium]
MSPQEFASPKSCCIFRLSALGDITHVLPLLRALQDAWPACEFTWIIGKREQQLVNDIKGVRFIVFDKRAGKAALRQFKQQMQRESFDILLHLQTSLRANLMSRYVRAQRRIGWDSSRAREGHRWVVNEQIKERAPQHQVQGFLAFARYLGIDVTQPRWDLPISAQAQQFAAKHMTGSKPWLVISPCSSHALRDWPLSHYQAIARFACEVLEMQVMVCGGPSPREREYGTGIAQAHPSIVNFVGKDTLPQLLALLQRAAIVVSPDSGPAHMASAVGTPVIGLHAATWSQRSGPYRSLDYCVDAFEQAALQFKRKPAQQLRWGQRIETAGVMNLVSVEAVKTKLQSLHQDLFHASSAPPNE